MKNPFVRRLKHNQAIPSLFWGLVGYEDYRQVTIIALIPLNFLWAFGRWMYAWAAWRASWFFVDRMPPNHLSTRKPIFRNGPDDDFGAIDLAPGPVIFVDETRCPYCQRKLDT